MGYTWGVPTVVQNLAKERSRLNLERTQANTSFAVVVYYRVTTSPRAPISTTKEGPNPLSEPLSKEIDQHPEMEVFRKCFVDEKPLSERPTLTDTKSENLLHASC